MKCLDCGYEGKFEKKEVKVSVWTCNVCGKVHLSKDEALECETRCKVALLKQKIEEEISRVIKDNDITKDLEALQYCTGLEVALDFLGTVFPEEKKGAEQ